MAWTSSVSSTFPSLSGGNPVNVTWGGGGGGGYSGGSYPQQQQWTTIQTVTPTLPTEGQTANINGKLYRYSVALAQWIEVVDAPESEILEAPRLPIILDASKMVTAFMAYRDFLESVADELDEETQKHVKESLSALEEVIDSLAKV